MIKTRDGKEAVILGNGPLSKTFKEVAVGDEKYLVWADTMRYRKDNELHEKDVIE